MLQHAGCIPKLQGLLIIKMPKPIDHSGSKSISGSYAIHDMRDLEFRSGDERFSIPGTPVDLLPACVKAGTNFIKYFLIEAHCSIKVLDASEKSSSE